MPDAASLRLVHGDVCVVQHVVGRRPPAVANATPTLTLARTCGRQRATSARGRAQDVLGDALGVAWRADVLDEQRELVSTEAGQRVSFAHQRAGAGRRWSRSSSSPVRWPRLSLVTLNRSTSAKSTAWTSPLLPAALERLLQAVEEEPAVRQAGEGVVEAG